jgi:hypothetical protein
VLLEHVIAHRVDEVCLAQADAAVDEQRVVRGARVLGHLERSRASELVRLAGDEAVEGELRYQARSIGMRGLGKRRAGRARRRRGGFDRLGGTRCLERQGHADRRREEFGAQGLDSGGETVFHPLQHEPVGSEQAQLS